jgi:hypothetical protein
MTGSNCVHRPSDDIDDVTLGSDSDYVTVNEIFSSSMSKKVLRQQDEDDDIR